MVFSQICASYRAGDVEIQIVRDRRAALAPRSYIGDFRLEMSRAIGHVACFESSRTSPFRTSSSLSWYEHQAL
jgi:hypothetical protein